MTESPNPTPGFIRQSGVLGYPVALTNQVCTRDSPGNVPLILYDNDSSTGYASGNGAIAENLVIAPTGTVAKSTLFIFWKFPDVANTWVYWDEVDLPALASVSASTKGSGYPLKASLSRVILAPPARVGSNPYPSAFRINGDSRVIQIGVALGTAIGSNPMYIWLDGGEL
jgi:hypothetical protein